MSLHRKIIGWFIVFGALAVTLFGIGDYLQSTYALRFALETRAGSLAVQVAHDVERRHERAQAELALVGYAAAAGAPLPALHGAYLDVRVERADRALFGADAIGASPQSVSGCAQGMIPFVVGLEDAAGRPLTVTAHMAVAHFFADVPSAGGRLGKRGLTAVFDAAGRPLYDAGCSARAGGDDLERAQAAVAELATREEAFEAGPVELVSERNELTFAIAAADAPPWRILIGVDMAEFAAPFVAVRRQYFAVVSAVLLLALSVMLVGVRRDMRRLEAISNAADAIGRGRFDVWLPPPTGDEIGRVSLALGRMIDRLSTTLRQIEVSRSMAAVGELATYLSHEIRNPLSSIRLNLQMLRRDLATGAVPDDGEQLVGLCLSELQRLEDVVRTVLEVGRTGRDARGACEAHAVVQETVRVMLGKFRDRRVAIETSLDAPRSDVAMASAALRSVVMNLLLNGLDALADREDGRILIATRLVDGDDEAPRLELRVRDNGPGIPAHLQARVFDPFFTTKATGNGIGLPTALRAVQECGGMLRCEPEEPGRGAEFVLELPLPAGAETTREEIMVAAGGR